MTMMMSHNSGDMVRIPQKTLLHKPDGYHYKITDDIEYAIIVEKEEKPYESQYKILLGEEFWLVESDKLPLYGDWND